MFKILEDLLLTSARKEEFSEELKIVLGSQLANPLRGTFQQLQLTPDTSLTWECELG